MSRVYACCCGGVENADGCRVCPDGSTGALRCSQSYTVSWSGLSYTHLNTFGGACRSGSIPNGCAVVDIPNAVWNRTDTSCACAPGRNGSQIPVGGDGWVNVYGDGSDSVFGGSCSVLGPGPNSICSGGNSPCSITAGGTTENYTYNAIQVELYCMCSSGNIGSCATGGSATKTFHVMITANDWNSSCVQTTNRKNSFRFDSSAVSGSACPQSATGWTLYANGTCGNGTCSGTSTVNGSITIEAGTSCG